MNINDVYDWVDDVDLSLEETLQRFEQLAPVDVAVPEPA